MPRIDITGDVYGRLTVVAELPTGANYRRYFECRCVCGKTIRVSMTHLRTGHTISCGCYRIDNPVRLTHGEAGKGQKRTKLYHVWDSMIQRCHNPNSSGYSKYGAKGITVCADWRGDYTTFASWAKRTGYLPGLTIERKDAYQGYSPANCIWVPTSEQGVSRRISSRNSSGYVGVSYHSTKGKWIARITVDGARINVGEFASPEEADAARYAYMVNHKLDEHIFAYENQQANT